MSCPWTVLTARLDLAQKKSWERERETERGEKFCHCGFGNLSSQSRKLDRPNEIKLGLNRFELHFGLSCGWRLQVFEGPCHFFGSWLTSETTKPGHLEKLQIGCLSVEGQLLLLLLLLPPHSGQKMAKISIEKNNSIPICISGFRLVLLKSTFKLPWLEQPLAMSPKIKKKICSHS